MAHQPYFTKKYRDDVNMENPHWVMVRLLTFCLTFGRDIILPLYKAQEAHHLNYRRLGREIPGIDLVPLHHDTHELITYLNRHGLGFFTTLVLRVASLGWASLWVFLLYELGLHIILSFR